MMRKATRIFIGILAFVLLNSCNEQVAEQQNVTPKVKVKVAGMKKGFLPNYIELTGKTIYLNKSNLFAPISGYITKVSIRQGDMTTKGKPLFEMQTPEAFLMRKKDSTSANYGKIKIYAPVNGRVVSLNVVNQDVFVDKGSVMCILLASSDLKIQVNVPFEYNKWAKIGNKCKVILPDSTEISGQFSKILPQVDATSQTVKVLANIRVGRFIPENMIVKVLLDKSTKHQSQILEKQCLQTNALMTKFWVMKLINDTIAVQVPVKIGNQTHKRVEIIAPQFNDNDKFISQGAYGLGDTTFVEIIK